MTGAYDAVRGVICICGLVLVYYGRLLIGGHDVEAGPRSWFQHETWCATLTEQYPAGLQLHALVPVVE